MRRTNVFVCIASAILAVTCPVVSSADAEDAKGFAFKDGDLVCFLGNTVIERAQRYGHVEAALTLAAASEGKSVRFRNLGWSGDTVFGHARSYFGPPKEGFTRLSGHLEAMKPSVVMICYGALNAFDPDPAANDVLIAGYGTLLDMVEAKTGGARIVIMSPPPLENHGPPLPDQTEANRRLAETSGRLKAFAEERGAHFVDLFAAMSGSESAESLLTENGVHYTEEGYSVLAARLLEGLGLKAVTDPGAEFRGLIKAKNTLYFDKWRPANETYLHGFRKHEQGQNAREMAQFDPFIDKAEKEISKAVKSLSKR